MTEEPPTDTGTEHQSPFTVLLEVQDLDTAIGQLEHRKRTLPERQELTGLEQQLGELAARTAESEGQRAALVERQRRLEQQIAALSDRRRTVEERLYSARGSAARDLQAMDEEVHHLADRRRVLEDDELALMEEQEPLDEALASLHGEAARLGEAADSVRGRLGAADAVIDAELAQLSVERARQAARLPADLSARYERLRARLKGTGAARLVANRCEGCHLELPSVELERIRRLPGDVLVTCDQCGRILVRTDDRPPGV